MHTIEELIRFAIRYEKLASSPSAFLSAISNYDNMAEATRDFALGLKLNAEQFKAGMDPNNAADVRTYALYVKQAQMLEALVPELQFLEDEINEMRSLETDQ